MGLYLLKSSVSGSFNTIQRSLGRFLLKLAPVLMKTLSIVGTAAVFLVGGGILVHAIPFLHHFVEHTVEGINIYPSLNNMLSSFSAILLNMLIGLIAGVWVLAMIKSYEKLTAKNGEIN